MKESQRNWGSYSKQKKEQIKAEGSAIYTDLIAVMDKGADSPEVQAIMARWHQHLRYFYEPTPEMLRGLGHLYNEHPDFIANFEAAATRLGGVPGAGGHALLRRSRPHRLNADSCGAQRAAPLRDLPPNPIYPVQSTL